MTIRGIAFDLEGTIINVEPAHHEGLRAAAQEFGLELSLEECFQLIPHFIGGPDEKNAEDVAALLYERKRTQVEPAEILEAKKKHYERLLEKLEIQPRQGFLKTYSAFSDKSLPMAIGSLTAQEQALALLQRSGVGDLLGYAQIVLREHVKNLKPAPDVWIETAKRMHISPEEQLVFEDSPRGIQGAVQIGAVCVGMPVYNRSDTVHALYTTGAQRVFVEWDEINPEALLRNLQNGA